MIIAFQTLVYYRESLLRAVDRLLRPYYTHFWSSFVKKREILEDEDDDQVFADYDDERGVVFYPPMYLQRYAAVSDCLMDERWVGKLEKVVDLGYHDMSFIKYLKELEGVKSILGVDIESIPLRCSSDLIGCDDYAPKRENPLQITLFQGNAADPDYRLIGTDAVIAIEMIEHMLPHDLDRLLHTVFGFIRPWIVIFTTPNGDFNVLFKALEKNGLRRWDHFFEWSREQFYDWCSNIIVRYPDFTVTCKGIGPGPPGTEHLGCCSQMALFVSKNYHKQQDLNINSLALVATPNHNNMSDIIGSWDTLDVPMETNMICPANESYSELFSDKLSSMTLMLSSTYSLENFTHQDQTLQCNLDMELSKSYMMFDYEQMFNTLAPSRKLDSKVYIMEDVNSRLNCTTLQVNKFSKATQNLLAKNNIDSLGHTREVVNEIRHLTKMLNFNKDSVQVNGSDMWCNINWGDNAPYWNQYYKVVREYSYPFETKSEECRILDLISDEINRLIDDEYEYEFSVDLNKLEIPIDHLMCVVGHITDDVDKVKDLLEWNGYEIDNDLLIYSRLVVDNTSIGTHEDDWLENETSSDYDSTDIHSTTVSDRSTIVPDYHARCLRRALDYKVRKLRTMLTADQDVTTELDRVVCRLMKLALRSSRGRQSPPPTRWMQCKLLDLLTLTEKAIERRKKYFIENYPLRAISFDTHEKSQKMVALEKIKEDVTALKIVDKYRHLVQQPEEKTDDLIEPHDQYNTIQYKEIDTELDDDRSGISADYLKDYHINSPDIFETFPNPNGEVYILEDLQEKYKLERTQAWLEDDIEIVSYPNHDVTFDNTSIDSDLSKPTNINKVPMPEKMSKTIPKKHHKPKKSSNESKFAICKISHSHKRVAKVDKTNRTTKTGSMKKVSRKKSRYNNLVRNFSNKMCVPVDYKREKVNNFQEQSVHHTKFASQPIPSSYVELDPTDIPIDQHVNNMKDLSNEIAVDNDFASSNASGVSATVRSHFVEIISESGKETIALRRTIGTDAEDDSFLYDEMLIRSMSNNNLLTEDHFTEKHEIVTENVQAQTIFVYDINEPTTSKGIRHVGMDVQCGPDEVAPFTTLSATTSLTKMPKMFTTGIKIGDSLTETNIIMNSCTYTYDNDNDSKTKVPRQKSVSIVIKDSSTELCPNVECSTTTKALNEQAVTSEFCTETETIKPVPSSSKMEGSSSDLCGSFNGLLNTLRYDNSNRNLGIERKLLDCGKPSLCCGGVQVHSYREKQSSEDIMFQGDWQRYRPKVVAKKKGFIPVLIKKTNSLKLSKEKLELRKDSVKKDLKALAPKKPSIVRPKLQQLTRTRNSSQPRNISGPKLATPVTTGISSQKRFKEEPNLSKIKHKTPLVKTDKDPPIKRNIPSPVKVNRLPVKVKNTANIEASKSATKLRKQFTAVGKVSSKHTLSFVTSKNLKSSVVKKPSVNSNKTITKDEPSQKNVRKSYIPLYLRKNANKVVIKESPKEPSVSGDIVKTVTLKENNAPVSLENPTANELKADIFEFQAKIAHTGYLVLRNEIDNNESANQGHSVRNIPERNKDGITKRAISPQTPTSSTCSSPNSIATVRAVKLNVRSRSMNYRRHSTSPPTSYTGNSGSETTTPNKNKKFTKRAKTGKTADDCKQFENKENIPQTSRQYPGANRGNDNLSKNLFLGKKKVFIAQFKENSNLPSTLNKGKPHKSNIDMAKNDNSQKKSSASSVSQKSSGKSATSYSQNTTENSDKSNMVLVLEPQKLTEILNGGSADTVDESPKKVVSNVVTNHRLIIDWMDNSKKSIVSHKSNIVSSMRQLIEETLDFIDPFDNNWPVDSETVILSPENSSFIVEKKVSKTSFKTLITSDDSSTLQRDLERVLNRTYDPYATDDSLSHTKLGVSDLDESASYKSLTSRSKDSDYLLACDDTQSTIISPLELESSMRDLYERREQPVQNATGALASQAFSGFTINEETVAGDQPDPINMIDSETGSMMVDINRRAASEELFVSGRSSGSFASCLLEDDSVVPNWLFQIISHQHSAIDDLQPPEQLLPMPLDDDVYDVNGNVEGVGVGAGAGDGRGIHSDHSPDSSGRGTSITSSDTSSGPQSEATLMDPSTLMAQFEMLRDARENSVAVQNDVANNETTTRQDMNHHNFSHGESTRNLRPESALSDADADVSSTDTDVPSDN